jgi:hypothetical protein
MRRQAAFAAIVLCFVAAAARAAPRWTFCVAAAGGGADVWISDVFVVERDREKLEGAFKSAVERLGASAATAQCPQPRDDKTVAVNAQIDAKAFNRKIGATLHPVAAADFPPRR